LFFDISNIFLKAQKNHKKQNYSIKYIFLQIVNLFFLQNKNKQ
jgi:hypothetical protein